MLAENFPERRVKTKKARRRCTSGTTRVTQKRDDGQEYKQIKRPSDEKKITHVVGTWDVTNLLIASHRWTYLDSRRH